MIVEKYLVVAGPQKFILVHSENQAKQFGVNLVPWQALIACNDSKQIIQEEPLLSSFTSFTAAIFLQ